jgi:hypothetical protein
MEILTGRGRYLCFSGYCSLDLNRKRYHQVAELLIVSFKNFLNSLYTYLLKWQSYLWKQLLKMGLVFA